MWIARALPVVVGLALVACGDAAVALAPHPFPLANGNHWTLRQVDSGVATTISVRRSAGRLVLHGFPGAGDLRVRRAGQTLEAWDPADGRWEAFFRFGAPVGTRYVVKLPRTPLWHSVEVSVASKSAAVRDYNGKLRRGCTRFTFSYEGVADAGLEHLSFAPGIGPVRYSESTIAGPRTYALAAFKVKGP